jgi:hypothetical protein
MFLTDPDQSCAGLPWLIAEPEALATAALALAPWEADPSSLVFAIPGLLVGPQGSTEVDGRFLEHLRRYLTAPLQARYLRSEDAVRGGNEDATGGLATLPGVEGVDQIKPRPRNQSPRVCSPGGKCVDDQP